MDLFDKIINKEIEAEIIFENDRAMAFMDINPERPGHFLVVPKVHSTNMIDITDEDIAYLIVVAKGLANDVIKNMGVSGYNIVINNGVEAGQEIFHTHIHVIPTIK